VKKIVLDIGANSGQFSEYVLKNFKNSKVIAFEPNSRFEPRFKNLLKNYEGRFDYEIKALSNFNGTDKFYFTIDPSEQLSSLLKPNPVGLWDSYSKLYSINNVKASKVLTCNGKFIKQKYGGEIYLAKIDVQGSDISVARDLLSNLDINFLIVEFQSSSLKNESVYLGQKNSLVELSKLITKFNLSTIKLIPNSANLVEFNVLLSKKNVLSDFDLDFINMLIDSDILKRFSEILPIGDVPYRRLVRKLNRILKSILLKTQFNTFKA
jgi:FkbM family methyltransferase